MTGPIDRILGNFRIQQMTTEKANEAALVDNKPILRFAPKSNPIANLSMAAKPGLDFSGLPLSPSDQRMVARYVLPEQQERIGNYMNNLVSYA